MATTQYSLLLGVGACSFNPSEGGGDSLSCHLLAGTDVDCESVTSVLRQLMSAVSFSGDDDDDDDVWVDDALVSWNSVVTSCGQRSCTLPSTTNCFLPLSVAAGHCCR